MTYRVPVPTPAQVAEDKQKFEQGQRLPENRSERRFFCRGCGKEEHGIAIPENWYSLQRHQGPTQAPHRLGVYCTIACLIGQLPRLRGIERELAEEWQQSVAPYGQKHVNERHLVA